MSENSTTDVNDMNIKIWKERETEASLFLQYYWYKNFKQIWKKNIHEHIVLQNCQLAVQKGERSTLSDCPRKLPSVNDLISG